MAGPQGAAIWITGAVMSRNLRRTSSAIISAITVASLLGFAGPVGGQGRALLWSWWEVVMWASAASAALPAAWAG